MEPAIPPVQFSNASISARPPGPMYPLQETKQILHYTNEKQGGNEADPWDNYLDSSGFSRPTDATLRREKNHCKQPFAFPCAST